MELEVVASAYQEALRARFPTVHARVKREGSQVVVEAFSVPDGQSREFMRYILDELPALLKGMAYLPITPYSENATRKYFPEVRGGVQKRPARSLSARRPSPASVTRGAQPTPPGANR
jgi:hypothetical protein